MLVLADDKRLFPARRRSARGRGAKSNDSGRFEAFTRHGFHDGWDGEPDDPPQLKTELLVEKARKIITHNDSPDIGFNSSIDPYRGCEHGWVYPPVTHMGARPGIWCSDFNL